MNAEFLTGIEVLLRDHPGWLRHARVGLVAHPASVSAGGVHSARLLSGLKRSRLCCLFGPEHGFTGASAAGAPVGDGREEDLQLPVRSLYGKSRRPTAAMLRDLDVLVYDLQDLGVRCYTYVSTLRYLLEAAARHGKRVVVADRPIPLANTVDGAMLERSFSSFVGCIPAPLVYGMTPGETARWLVTTLGLDVDLRVAPLHGYTRQARRPQGGPPWIPPSPAIRSRESAFCYPVTVVTEALPALDCGRNGPHPFQSISMPGLRPGEVREALTALELPGVRFDILRPGGCEGVRLRVVDPESYQPVATSVAVLCVLRDLYGRDVPWRNRGTRPEFFDRLMGTAEVRQAIRAGESAGWIAAGWVKPRAAFEEQRRRHLLYAKPSAVRVRPRSRAQTSAVRRPRKAVVLAAGYGTRMRPLTQDVPKPLMPLWGKPVLQHALELLASWGVRDVAINCHHLPSGILSFAARQPVPGLRLALSFEPEVLGTGGALRRLQWFMGDEPFWMLNADIAADLDPLPLREDFARNKRIASLWLDPVRGPRTVEVQRGRVRNFRSPRPGTAGTATLCGLHLVDPRILHFLPQAGFATIVDAYEKAMRAGHVVGGVTMSPTYWSDLGSPQTYLDAHAEIRNRHRAGQPGGRLFDPKVEEGRARLVAKGVEIRGFLAADPSAQVSAGARVENSVLWQAARLSGGARIKGAIVGPHTRVTGGAAHMAVRGISALDANEREMIRKAGFSIADTTAILVGTRSGSARTFMRMVQGPRRAILVRYDPAREENRLYVPLARFLGRQGMSVPRVLLDRPAACRTLLEDAGDTSLEMLARTASRRRLVALYQAVLDQTLRLHGPVTRQARKQRITLRPPFSPALYAWEIDLFVQHFLINVTGASVQTVKGIADELRANAALLHAARPVLLHRDLQSSNILLAGRRIRFIDFQGMRYGPAAYDLASLLYDPYVTLPAAVASELLDYYLAGSEQGDEVRSAFPVAAVQRLAQALGAYGRLGALPGGTAFRRHIPEAMARLQRVAGARGNCPELVRYLECVKL